MSRKRFTAEEVANILVNDKNTDELEDAVEGGRYLPKWRPKIYMIFVER